MICQCLFHHGCCKLLVGCPAVQLRQGKQRRRFSWKRRLVKFFSQRARGLFDPVQSKENLKHIPVGFTGFWPGFFPCLRCRERRLSGPGLQGNVCGALVKLFVIAAARCLQQQGVACFRFATAVENFANQDLVKRDASNRACEVWTSAALPESIPELVWAVAFKETNTDKVTKASARIRENRTINP